MNPTNMNLTSSNDDRNQPKEPEEQEELSEEQAKTVSGGLISIPDGDLYPSGSSTSAIAEKEDHLS
jgi:hypothetical protein